ncbi:Type I restriction-modification system methyltransferase subunit [Pseudomonas putida]|nr:Type I restriction-modification system methyltransferase subunit [Pseudomonas putida]CAB5637293.1 Type I restriction-modification system methyltransferase subunit [Pseudomonas putida]CAB5660017.1 Type I restriction-modification system methyltransferase subunit [Pseudomonas putida]CAB5683355.1 Type I restriction-modification system methyltransferase subunit [Pseudomonas putida]CAC9686275.1 Type I restriction-modification system methyltransferase subunit [Pseudomonas putida]
MNTSHIKSYAPKARTAFIAAMTKRAALFGIRESSIPAMGIAPVEQKGDLALIGDRAFPASIIRPRTALVKRVEQLGFAQAMEQAAYSWFNRLCAIRYMELKDYLDHGRRVLSAADGSAGTPQILEDCLEVDLPGLDKQLITELKLDGNKDEELYRELLLAQCHALHQAMPFLFEAVDDATELLLPDNLTKTDSLIRELVSAIPEDDWANIEIIGWLYQFYISEKKDQVIGKVVKSEDIPAATQLFTPNWIVKYMVQNSLGAQWLATYPDSPLKAQMEYYIEPAEQTDEVKAQLAAITPESLNPEELTLIDPASGSGHILVEAYDLFKAIYLERGYRQRDVAQLILEKNLFGLDIDERAAQLTGFALMMKGRADDRRLFERGVKLNVMALVDSAGFDPEILTSGLNLADYGLQLGDLTELKRLFEHATTFGSLIQAPEGLAKKLPGMKQLSEATSKDLFVADELKRLGALVRQAELLSAQYDAVVANPPYMGSKSYCPALKSFVNDAYKAGKADLYGAFTLRNILLAKNNGCIGMITIPNWMFLSSFEQMRGEIISKSPISSLVHNGRGIWGSDFGSCSYVLRRCSMPGLSGRFLRLFEKAGSVASNEELQRRFHVNRRFTTSNNDFKRIPGSPVAYWLSEDARKTFDSGVFIKSIATTRVGMATGDNDRFVRFWFEVALKEIGFNKTRKEAKESGKKWFPYSNGGEARKWYANYLHIVNWEDDGHLLQTEKHESGRIRAHNFNLDRIFEPGLTWSLINVAYNAIRVLPSGFIFSSGAPSLFCKDGNDSALVLGLYNSIIAQYLLNAINPTVNNNSGDADKLPLCLSVSSGESVRQLVGSAVEIARSAWDTYESSWGFQIFSFLACATEASLESSYIAWINQNRATIAEMKRLEEENNRLFIEAYGLAEELTPDVPIEQITLTINPAYRYGGKMSEDELWTRFREDSMQELVSYAVGCMMGRYSLDEPGLIYAHSGNQGFDPSRYTRFPADADGILPLTDKEWFADDAANRLIEFISVAWDKTHLEANLRFLADNLSPKKTESSRDTLRRYLCDNFFKDHLQTYKKRPIYWLFSSGKQKAFQCLVYLHRYNEGTLARMRTEYVIPLSAKLSSYAAKLEKDIEASNSTAEKKALEKQLSTLHNQQAELATFDEKLRHYADQRISLDLDDGVKVNYGKFGDLLAEVKAVTGGKEDS